MLGEGQCGLNTSLVFCFCFSSIKLFRFSVSKCVIEILFQN